MLTLLSAGSNAQGQLGNTTIDDSHIFQACSFATASPGTLPVHATDVMDIVNGSNHTLVLLGVRTADGVGSTEVWGCGDGRKGQLGPDHRQRHTNQGSTTIFQRLMLDPAFDKLGLSGYVVSAISATWETSYLSLTRPGKHDVIVSFGSNEFGDLGVGRDAGDKLAEEGPGAHIVDFSRVIVDGNTIDSAQTVVVERLRAGQRHIIAALKVVWNGREPTQVLVGWGARRHGQLDDTRVPPQPTYQSYPTLVMSTPTPSNFTIEYSLGIHHSVFLHASGRVSFRGSNRKNQVQGLDGLQMIRDIKCTWNGTYALTSDDPARIFATGSNSHGQLGRTEDTGIPEVKGVPPIEGNKGIKALACGSEHLLVCLTGDGINDEVWGCGWNEHGNLGLGNTIDSPVPLKIWPPSYRPENIEINPIRNIWGGTGSSWILCGTFNAAEDMSPQGSLLA
ncbi:RCC1/BLIP-II [Macrolepiota fuliginosa MF-IS2]|uniref:RCC1/BLIP-II n=1 Tax=Macrolepiota fuliginosa MF-IS2 TaxID=1400762 RepID=A0A9P5X1C0_9AGAR|nr:RCC1/BLIP-II [Macrolepiota fuliginosa MF-IS2]